MRSNVRAIDLSAASWRKGSYSNHSPVLVFPALRWAAFVSAVKGGTMDA